MDLLHYPYPSARKVVLGQHGAVATSQPLAALAGMEMLQRGGSAIDAAVAAAIALTVVEPTTTGIGGDAFALVWDGSMRALNSSGASPAGFTLEPVIDQALTEIPLYGWLPVTVPGAVAAWQELSDRYGKLPFEVLFEPAIRYAEKGYPISPETARFWRSTEGQYLGLEGKAHEAFKLVFFPHGRAPAAGEIWGSADHAASLRKLAREGAASLYQGGLAKHIAQFAEATGGYLALDDLRAHKAIWVEPTHTRYRDIEVWEVPPNSQGVTALIALNILENFDLSRFPRESTEAYHLQVEAIKLAIADAKAHVADPRFMKLAVQNLLDKAYSRERAALISDRANPMPASGLPKGGTVYVAAADDELMVSFIQSQ
jgi:gamma-glutamyltranspeptidase / glutathione hydrolase